MAVEASELRKGNAVRLGGHVLVVVDLSHVKPGKGPAYLQAKLRDVASGGIRDHRFRINETIERVFTERRKIVYSYRAGDDVIFLDEETFDEIRLPRADVGDRLEFFAEGESIEALLADGALVGVEFPEHVVRTVVQTMGDVKAAKVTNQVKPATLDTGVEIAVPIFIREGDRIRLHVPTGKYHERIS